MDDCAASKLGSHAMICERCCAHFAGELSRPKIWEREAGLLKKILSFAVSFAFQVLVLTGNALFFCVAIWFVPHPETPLKRRQRRLNEAFAYKRDVQVDGLDLHSAYELDAGVIRKKAEDALSVGLAEIQTSSNGQPDYVIRQRENQLRKAVEEVYANQMSELNLTWNQALEIQIGNEKKAAELLKNAHRSAYG